MATSTAYGLLSAAAYGIAATGSGPLLGPETCIPVGAVVLLAIASPRDLWGAFRRYTGDGGADDDGA